MKYIYILSNKEELGHNFTVIKIVQTNKISATYLAQSLLQTPNCLGP